MLKVTIREDAEHPEEGHSSKGNQWKRKSDDWWYKADAFGYESLSEIVVSHLLLQSNIRDVAVYEPVTICYGKSTFRGCRSRNFQQADEMLFPLERLERTYTGVGLAEELSHIPDVKQRIIRTVTMVNNLTGIEDFGKYLTQMLEMDAFFLNEDRHTNNIAVLYDTMTNRYRPCVYYDMGLSLFADSRESFSFDKSLEACRQEITAKPFSRDFDEQLDAANELYGCYLKFAFPASRILKKVREIFKKYALTETCAYGYRKEELERVEAVLVQQARKYSYMFER